MSKAPKDEESSTTSGPESAEPEEERGTSPELQAYIEKVLDHISRMAVDEEYRKQVSSFLP